MLLPTPEKLELVLQSVIFAWMMFFSIFLVTVCSIGTCFFLVTRIFFRGRQRRVVIISDESRSGRKRRDRKPSVPVETRRPGKLLLPFTSWDTPKTQNLSEA